MGAVGVGLSCLDSVLDWQKLNQWNLQVISCAVLNILSKDQLLPGAALAWVVEINKIKIAQILFRDSFLTIFIFHSFGLVCAYTSLSACKRYYLAI